MACALLPDWADLAAVRHHLVHDRRYPADFAHGKADGGGKLVIGAVGVHVQRYELILQQLLLRGELYGIAPNPRVAHVNSPVRRDGPAIGLSGPLDVLEFALACAHIPSARATAAATCRDS